MERYYRLGGFNARVYGKVANSNIGGGSFLIYNFEYSISKQGGNNTGYVMRFTLV